MDDHVDTLTTELASLDEGSAVIRIAGEIDMETCEQVTDTCRDAVVAGAVYLILDLAAVTFMDSSGIAALIDTRSLATVTLRNPSAAVVRLLETTGLTTTFEVEP